MAPPRDIKTKSTSTSNGSNADPRDDIRRLIGEARERKDEFLAYLLSLALAHASERAIMDDYMSGELAE